MIDVSDLIEDPDFASPYQVIRTGGRWERGRFVPLPPEMLHFYGPVQPASVRELEQIPEGDRQKGIVKFICKMPRELYLTRTDGISDEIVWRGERFKVMQIMPWNHMGWMRAFAFRIGGYHADQQKSGRA